MSGENSLEFIEIESENYTYVSSTTLQMEFPQRASDEVLRERPSEPLLERTPEEIAQLLNHPFFATE